MEDLWRQLLRLIQGALGPSRSRSFCVLITGVQIWRVRWTVSRLLRYPVQSLGKFWWLTITRPTRPGRWLTVFASDIRSASATFLNPRLENRLLSTPELQTQAVQSWLLWMTTRS